MAEPEPWLDDWGEVPGNLPSQDRSGRKASPIFSAAMSIWRTCTGSHHKYDYGVTVNSTKQSGACDFSKNFGTYQLDLGNQPNTDQTGSEKNWLKTKKESREERERYDQHEQDERHLQQERQQNSKPLEVVEESKEATDEIGWGMGSLIIPVTELGLPDVLDAELELYIRTFQSKFTNQYALSLPCYSHEDEVLVGFLGRLLQTVSDDCPCTTLMDISKAMKQHFSNTGFEEGSAHREVISKYWEPFVLQLHQCPDPRRSDLGKWVADDACRILVETYVTRSIWYAYWRHREKVKPFNDWKGAKQALLQTTAGILEEYSSEKWEKLNAMHNRFIMHWGAIQGKLQGSASVSDEIKRVFDSSQTTWKCAIEAVQDIRHDRIPPARNSAAALVLAVSIDTIHNQTPTSRFYEALAQWVVQDGGEISYFIDLCWPSWIEHRRDSGFCGSEGLAAFPEQIALLNSLFSTADSINDFRTTRSVLEQLMDEFMDEDDFVVLPYDISVEAAASILIFDDDDLVDDLSTDDPPGPARPMQLAVNPFTAEPGISLISDWVDGAIIISGIVVHFLIATALGHMKGPDPSYRFIGEDAFQKVIKDTRDGRYLNVDDVKSALIQIVPIDSIGTVLRLCGDLASLWKKMGPLTCGQESKQVLRENNRISVDTCMSDASVVYATGTPSIPLLADSPVHPDTRNWTPMATSVSPYSQTMSSGSSNSGTMETPPVQGTRRVHHCSHDGCPKVFPTSSNRRRHEKSVHGGTTACSYCLKLIKDRADYKKKHAKACKAQSREEF
ncbi:hypothetical protein K440DRAFT_679383 [Wilcoxina mikolae CBS 423.85]|nr:hypothetical protein K440DRAFT_679383 [Wilcoxina mikolae CBS 423.85]